MNLATRLYSLKTKLRSVLSRYTLRGMWSGGPTVSCYWLPIANFGDLLSPLLLDHYGFRVVHRRLRDADTIAVGSLLQKMEAAMNVSVLGTGLIRPERQDLSNCTVYGLRGPLTAANVVCSGSPVLGDPGLLARHLISSRETRVRFGIVPHYIDQRKESTRKLVRYLGGDVKVIDVRREPLSVVNAISQCECIFSSSLHGLVVADSLGIPNARVVLSSDVRGGDFKFRDHDEVVGVTRQKLDFSRIRRLRMPRHECVRPDDSKVAATVEALDNMFRQFFKDTLTRRVTH